MIEKELLNQSFWKGLWYGLALGLLIAAAAFSFL